MHMARTRPSVDQQELVMPGAQRTSPQELASLIKSARDIMRKDKGLSGDADRVSMGNQEDHRADRRVDADRQQHDRRQL